MLLAGDTLRVIVFVFAVCTNPSDQVSVYGRPSPVIVAVSVADPPGQIEPPPLTVTELEPYRVMVALPLEVPLQRESVMDVIAYVVATSGATFRVAVVPLATVWTTPSDQVTVNGAVPVRVAVIAFVVPSQHVPVPLMTADGAAAGYTDALPPIEDPQTLGVTESTLKVVGELTET